MRQHMGYSTTLYLAWRLPNLVAELNSHSTVLRDTPIYNFNINLNYRYTVKHCFKLSPFISRISKHFTVSER